MWRNIEQNRTMNVNRWYDVSFYKLHSISKSNADKRQYQFNCLRASSPAILLIQISEFLLPLFQFLFLISRTSSLADSITYHFDPDCSVIRFLNTTLFQLYPTLMSRFHNAFQTAQYLGEAINSQDGQEFPGFYVAPNSTTLPAHNSLPMVQYLA